MFDNAPMPPRMIGMTAARNLSVAIEDNPMDKEPLTRPGDEEANQHLYHQPGHPHYEWEAGFKQSRILMHIQQRRILALGIGVALAAQHAPKETAALVIALGRKAGELTCLTILSAMMESEGTTYDLDHPESILAIYGGMKCRMANKPPTCGDPDLQGLTDRVHNLAGILKVIFPQTGPGVITLDTKALEAFLRDIAQINHADAQSILNHP